MTAVLLDGNVLVALTVSDHVHHDAARAWFVAGRRRFATTPITQGTLLRMLLRIGVGAADSLAVLDAITGHRRHDFWSDDQPFTKAALRGVVGHRQVTDAYLAHLARTRHGRVVTFDRGLAELHPDVTDLLDP